MKIVPDKTKGTHPHRLELRIPEKGSRMSEVAEMRVVRKKSLSNLLVISKVVLKI